MDMADEKYEGKEEKEAGAEQEGVEEWMEENEEAAETELKREEEKEKDDSKKVEEEEWRRRQWRWCEMMAWRAWAWARRHMTCLATNIAHSRHL